MDSYSNPISEEVFTYEKLDLKIWIAEKIDHCRKFFNEDQHLPYMIHYFTKNKNNHIEEHVIDLTNLLNNKDLMAELIPMILKQQKAFAYFTCCEAWMKAFNKGENPQMESTVDRSCRNNDAVYGVQEIENILIQ